MHGGTLHRHTVAPLTHQPLRGPVSRPDPAPSIRRLGAALSGCSRARSTAPAPRSLDVPPTIAGSFQGMAQIFEKSLKSTPILILAAIFTVYIVLGMLYESYIHPITILSTLPSAGVGALLALMLFGYESQHHRSDRHHPADRHRQEERHHDDRLRAQGRARAGHEPARGDPPGLPDALSVRS